MNSELNFYRKFRKIVFFLTVFFYKIIYGVLFFVSPVEIKLKNHTKYQLNVLKRIRHLLLLFSEVHILYTVLLFWSGFSRMRGGVAVIAIAYTEDYGRESLGGLNGSK